MSHSVHEILNNDVKIRNNRQDIYILDKRQNTIALIEVRITSQDFLQVVETEKLRKYDLSANYLGLIMFDSAKKTAETISFDQKEDSNLDQIPKRSGRYNVEDGGKTENTKNILTSYFGWPDHCGGRSDN
ncbi:hypothetical protein CWI38_0140p0020 [Hamiltosporidium tvaerminnensis]|uniref:Uncharacterized protein n=1 Tax=Hamiltosporidium tvaerminnensis TaxID=1176355 RepID=A0A4V2JY82_9MICR|nr:hypothetical protein CWI38_0822p0030 [Hamiltosporidium tvaerminnensis]TBU20053.1 hypothetical protein CWI38_0140p0020 [Hamiltosporidium tvaerminnensis]